ncbi:hypothetical protein WR25_20969 isoform A [Diploscapter pachys]|uniref:Ubiquitin carboxyl-terminal hydrolase 36 n=2 Tax=Diploscapter pachys TaxID=2018661 RepID=A0A2A2K4R5_9BILA|nr:hypothetical protein WR25_20969 isoform A [Diploscapter pachys]
MKISPLAKEDKPKEKAKEKEKNMQNGKSADSSSTSLLALSASSTRDSTLVASSPASSTEVNRVSTTPKKLKISIGKEVITEKSLSLHLVEYSESSSSGDEEEGRMGNGDAKVERKKDRERSNSPEPSTSRQMIGPMLPSSTLLKSPSKSPIKTPDKRQSISQPSSARKPEKRPSSISDEGTASKRKRLLSERGEKELDFPVMDKSTNQIWNWFNCQQVKTLKHGCGLINNSNDCFLNSILQMLTHTAPVARYIFEKHEKECTRPPSGIALLSPTQNSCFACGYRLQYLKKLYNNVQPVMSTMWIRSFLKKIFPNHIQGMQEDAHELLTLLLDALEPPPPSAQKQAIQNGYTNGNSNGAQSLPNGLSSKPSTAIEQIFGGTLRNQITCDECQTPHINYERIRELNLAIRRKPSMDREAPIPLTHLIDIYFRDENVGEFECKKCNRKVAAMRRTRILRPPAVLIIQLKRFNAWGNKIRFPVTSDKELDLQRHMYNSEPQEYVLTSLVEHLGSGVDHGHYVSMNRGFDHDSWWLFDDEQVVSIPPGKIYSNTNAYLLVYSRKQDYYPKITPSIPISPQRTPNGYKSTFAPISIPKKAVFYGNKPIGPMQKPFTPLNGYGSGSSSVQSNGGSNSNGNGNGNGASSNHNGHNGNGFNSHSQKGGMLKSSGGAASNNSTPSYGSRPGGGYNNTGGYTNGYRNGQYRSPYSNPNTYNRSNGNTPFKWKNNNIIR